MTSRKGFTLVEVVACTIILAIVTMGAVGVSGEISTMRTESRNTVYLGLHNLDVMERLRQMSYDTSLASGLLDYYDDTWFSSSNIRTTVHLTMATWDEFHVYNVRIDSSMRNYQQTLTSNYVLTDIARYRNPDDDEDYQSLEEAEVAVPENLETPEGDNPPDTP